MRRRVDCNLKPTQTCDDDMMNERVNELREAILRAFPSEAYDGVITPYDDRLDDPDFDEEQEISEALKGKKWTDVPQPFLEIKPDGYMRLADEALPVFLGAWLIRSLENMKGENEIRDFLIYSFSPKHDMVPDTTEFSLSRLRALSPEQRHVLHSLMMDFAESDPSAFQRKLASEGVALLDSLG